MSKALTSSLKFFFTFSHFNSTFGYPVLRSRFIHPETTQITQVQQILEMKQTAIFPECLNTGRRAISHLAVLEWQEARSESKDSCAVEEQSGQSVVNTDMSHSSLEAPIYIPLST